jgi:L-threonylcarbamoyladenylate synthase
MIIYNKDEVKVNKDVIINTISKGSVFIYPTDTIYGIGCDATNSHAVLKIREIKNRYTNPFSVIAPSKEWIRNNCELPANSQEWVSKLPGPYTLILKLKNKSAIAKEINNGLDTVGIRIPNHWISDLATKIGKPIVTTSANKSQSNFMTSLEDLDQDIKKKVDFIIYDGEIKGKPSTIIHLDSEEVKIKER